MMGKRGGAVGEGIITIYRILIVVIIALVVFGVYKVFYVHIIDVRDSEARILARNLGDCLFPRGQVMIDSFKDGELLSLCSYSGDLSRYYVKVDVVDAQGKLNKQFLHGDSGLLWIKDFFKSNPDVQNAFAQYKPGYFKESYPVLVVKGSSTYEGMVNMEVLVNAER